MPTTDQALWRRANLTRHQFKLLDLGRELHVRLLTEQHALVCARCVGRAEAAELWRNRQTVLLPSRHDRPPALGALILDLDRAGGDDFTLPVCLYVAR
jgi:hypothetical protein